MPNNMARHAASPVIDRRLHRLVGINPTIASFPGVPCPNALGATLARAIWLLEGHLANGMASPPMRNRHIWELGKFRAVDAPLAEFAGAGIASRRVSLIQFPAPALGLLAYSQSAPPAVTAGLRWLKHCSRCTDAKRR